jgi:hypothetical protein
MLLSNDFETFGKTAASEYVGNNVPLDETIIKLAEHYGLNSEQVARVVEHANIETYLKLNKAADDKYIEYDPADPIKIASALNFKAEKTAALTSDYTNIFPDESYSTLYKYSEEDLTRLQTAEEKELDHAIKTAKLAIVKRLEEVDELFARESENLYKQVKQASLESGNFGRVKQAMLIAVPGNTTQLISDAYKIRLQKEAAFINFDDGEQPTGMLNHNHPVVESLVKLSVLKDEYITLNELYGEFEKDASKKTEFVASTVKAVGKAFPAVGELVGEALTTFKKVPSLLVGVGAGAAGVGIGRTAGTQEALKTNVKRSPAYVQRAKAIRPL